MPGNSGGEIDPRNSLAGLGAVLLARAQGHLRQSRLAVGADKNEVVGRARAVMRLRHSKNRPAPAPL
ncbi:hypothetical protein SKAU_G00348830 [Synaphobranchus kaupii]|uniref:Uncharacterized protein n=1 Tax=Synaphobranchus kaupii TaxID=118154 RepID=A0A9Q1EK40_SYNKA|nr:hypothetical protein SKAU_G00348830 [Synaphobranchus kaupii]